MASNNTTSLDETRSIYCQTASKTTAGKNEEVSDFNTKNHKKAKMDFACGHMSWISEWTEDFKKPFLRGFVWILMAFISFVATIIYGIIHVIAKEEKIDIIIFIYLYIIRTKMFLFCNFFFSFDSYQSCRTLLLNMTMMRKLLATGLDKSLVCISDTAVLHLISLLKVICEQRGSFVFRLSYYCKELEAFATVVHFMIEAIPLCIKNQEALPLGSLFPPLEGSYDKYYEMLKGLEQLDSTCFYGRPLGFQFSPSINRIFRFIGIVLASYSLSWEKGHGPIGSIINTGRFFLSPEQRASRIVKHCYFQLFMSIRWVTKEADIAFCKGFWNLSELSNNMPKWFCPNMAINELKDINWVGPIILATSQGGKIEIPEPSAHTGQRAVKIRVLSPVHRPYIVCDFKIYLVNIGINNKQNYYIFNAKLVVGISEKSLNAISWTGEKLCMVGDSAGGNLIMSVNLRLIELDVKRRPDGIVPVYTPFLFQYLPSPSRLLSVMDPLLHMGVVLRCVAAYTGGYGNLQKNEENSEGSGHKSLQEYVEQVQKTQRIEFSGGSHSIVSLVQNINDSRDKGKVAEASSFFIEEEKPGMRDDDSDEDDVDTRNMLYLIYIFCCSSLTVVDENGEIIEEAEEALTVIPHAEEKEKRPRLLNFISGNSSNTMPNTPCEGSRSITSSVSTNNIQSNTPLEKQKSHILDLLSNSAVPRDPLISPLYASDSLIKQLPPTYFIACHLDPLLDDTIAFASKLRSAGGKVMSLDLVPAVPHGFLNFTLMSPECRRGAKICLQRIKQALGISK
uniref:Hormone-sensitive lipase n=1 Tax=Heterorhabditis bacteriophora TaxID=37862 RepID=A0A1I7X9D6_HETBA